MSDAAVEALGVRPIVPHGLALQLGDVVAVGKDWSVDLVGRGEQLLGVALGPARMGGSHSRWQWQSSSGVSVGFKAEGEASQVFPGVELGARIEISFSRGDAAAVEASGVTVNVLENVARLEPYILGAYARGKWRREFVLITALGTAAHFTLVASRSENSAVALGVDAEAPGRPGLSAAVGVAFQRGEVVSFVDERNAVQFWRGYRVEDRWFDDPSVGIAKAPEPEAVDVAPPVEHFEAV